MQQELPTPYNIFWRELRPALTAAGVSLPLYIYGIRRLKRIEGEDKPDGAGQTGYLNGVDPWVAIVEYIGHVKDGSGIPAWLEKAERG
jgi:hypothetical protein